MTPPDHPFMLRALLTENEAAEILSVCPRTLRKIRANGAIKFVQIGRSVRYRIPDIEAFIAAATIANDRPRTLTQSVSAVRRATSARGSIPRLSDLERR